MEKDGVTLARRSSGGGAVFQDLGNTNFTFLSSMKNYNKKNNTDIIINAIKKFGLMAEASGWFVRLYSLSETLGRNDILVNGLKASGSLTSSINFLFLIQMN